MTGSLAYRKNEAAIVSGDVPEKYTRLLPFITGQRILEIGSAEGVLALLLARQGKTVTALEKSEERHTAALSLARAWGIAGVTFALGDAGKLCGDMPGMAHPLDNIDTLVAVRVIYYLSGQMDAIFAEVAKHVPNVVLCGNKNRAARWRAGKPDEPLGDMNRYAAREGMSELLERHGYRITKVVMEGDEIVVGER